MRRHFIAGLSFFAASCQFNAQEFLDDKSAYVKGFIGQGSGKVKGVESNSMWGLAAGISKDITQSNTEWVQLLNAKALNIGVIYDNFEGMQAGYTFGQSFGVQAQLEIGVIENQNFKLRAVPGFGLGYMTKTTFSDPETRIFGTHINGLFTADIKVTYKLSKNWEATAEAGFTHYSNGSFKIPNAGINSLNFGLGIEYGLNSNEKKSDSISNQKTFNIKKNGVEIVAGIGQRGRYQEHKGFMRMGFYAGYSHFFNQTFALRSGIDAVYYDQVYNPELYDDTVPYWGRSYDHWRLGVSVGGEVKMNRVAIAANLGHYLHMKSPTNQKWYWNATVKYYVLPKFGVQATLNAHKFQADFVNWGIFARF